MLAACTHAGRAAGECSGGESARFVFLLVHAIQFATPAELVRAETKNEALVTSGEQVAARGRLRRFYAIVLEHWKPFLEGRAARAAALERIAAAVANDAPR